MDKKVYIVHGSAIVQNGLADILRKNFKCVIKCFFDFFSFSQSEDSSNTKAILFVENAIANSKEYQEFIEKSSKLNSFSIINCREEETQSKSRDAVFLYNTSDEIYEQVKHAFKQQEHVEDKSEGLTNREIDVLKLVALGNSNKEIADKLYISTHTVMSHRKNMIEKLGIKSISGLTVYAIINNYIDTTNLVVKDFI